MLCFHSDHGGCDRQDKERDLLKDKRTCRIRQSAFGIRNSLERPVIQQQQDERQRHQHGLRHQPQGQRNEDHHISRKGPFFCVSSVCAERQYPERATEQIFPLGDPRDRFNAQWVNGENRRHESARAGPARHANENEEEQCGIERMQDQVRRMMAGRVRPVALNIQHVRQPRQRVPIRRVKRGEGPANAGRRDALLNVGIMSDVHVVVEEHKVVAHDRPEHEQREDDQSAADQELV